MKTKNFLDLDVGDLFLWEYEKDDEVKVKIDKTSFRNNKTLNVTDFLVSYRTKINVATYTGEDAKVYFREVIPL